VLACLLVLTAGCSTGAGGRASRPVPHPAPRPMSSATVRPTVPAAGTCHLGPAGRPDPICTPAALNPAVTQATIGRTICVPGWTATVRPPVSYTAPLKVAQIRAYGYADTRTASYEEDHLVPLELGGAPKDPRNLWPEPRAVAGGRGAGAKDAAENAGKTAVCSGATTLARAQATLLADWGPVYGTSPVPYQPRPRP
jgi:hypothetical protein